MHIDHTPEEHQATFDVSSYLDSEKAREEFEEQRKALRQRYPNAVGTGLAKKDGRLVAVVFFEDRSLFPAAVAKDPQPALEVVFRAVGRVRAP